MKFLPFTLEEDDEKKEYNKQGKYFPFFYEYFNKFKNFHH
jgi:hypothetical protein